MRQDDDYRDEDEPEEPKRRSFLQSGWLRALLVLVVLAVVLALALPYVMRWIGGGPPAPLRTAAKPSAPAAPPASVTPAAPVTPPVAAPASATPAPTAAVNDKPVASSPTPPAEEKTAPPKAVRDKTPPEKATAAEAEPSRPARRSASAAEPATKKSAPATAAEGGDYWVQVGAFRDERNAERLAATLRDLRIPVEVSRASRGARPTGVATSSGDRHEVFVSGATTDAVNVALRGAGTARAVSDGVVVQPALDLKDAVALSKRLSGEGLSVKIRRQSEKTVATGTSAYHVVRAGPYPTRARADAARQQLSGKGLGGFIAQGPAK